MNEPSREPQPDGDPWAWAHRCPEQDPEVPALDGVLAVLVAHNGSQWLARTLVALARLRARPGRLIAIDAASSDGSAQLLERAVREGILDACYTGPADQGFGASVNRAIELDSQVASPRNAGIPFEPEWLWLLHDDLEPRHDALDALLRATRGPQRIDVLVPKLLHPRLRNHADQMSALGESIAPNGARVPSVEPGDIDQRQQTPGPVLGGSTAGMFIRYSSWNHLGGLDPSIPLFRDGVDFGWRAHEAGLVVRSCPEAVLYHREAGRVGLRESLLAPDPRVADSVAGMRVASAHSNHPRRTRWTITVGSLAAALAYLVGKSPSGAAQQLRALHQFRSSRAETEELTQRVRARGNAAELPAGVLPDRAWNLRHGLDSLAGRASDAVRELRHGDDDPDSDELTGGAYVTVSVHRRVRLARLGTVLIAVITTMVAVRGLFSADPLVAARLLPAPQTLSGAWQAWMVPVAGAHGANAPWLGLAALGSTLAAGRPGLFIALWLASSVALATWVSARFFAKVCGRGWFANGLALSWGLALPVVGAISQGSADLVAVAVLLPGLGTALLRWRQRPVIGAEGWRAPAAVAVRTTLLAVFFPALALGVMVLSGGLARARRDLRGGLVAVMAPVIVLGPWLIRLATTPARLLTGIDPAAAPLSDAAGPLPSLLGRQLGGNTPWWVSILFVGLVIVGALIGYLLAPDDELDTPTRRVIAMAGAGALIIACALPHLVLTLGGTPVRPNGVEWYLAAIFVALALNGFGIGRPRSSSGDPGSTSPATDPGSGRFLTRVQMGQGLMIAICVLIGAAWWALAGASGSLHRAPSPLPDYVRAVEQSPRQTRTLMIDVADGPTRYALVDANSPRWGDGEVDAISPDPTMRREVASLAGQIALGAASDDLTGRLTKLGIGHLWVRGASADARGSLTGAPGITAALIDGKTTVWTLDDPVSRAVMRDDDRETPIAGTVPAGGGDRQLIISEPRSARWHAEVNGHSLAAADSGDWRQAFAVGTGGGVLRWHSSVAWVGCLWQVIALLAVIVLAAPAATSRTNAPRRALTSSVPSGAARRAADPEGFAVGGTRTAGAPTAARRRAVEQ